MLQAEGRSCSPVYAPTPPVTPVYPSPPKEPLKAPPSFHTPKLITRLSTAKCQLSCG